MRFKNFIAALALALLTGAAAHATHFTQQNVDAIDGNGPGVYFGGIAGSGNTANWYTFAANQGDSVTIETTAATFDTHLALYQVLGVPAVGDNRNSYTLIASDDDGGVGLLSLISVPSLTAGNYIVAVEEFGGSGGSYTLSISGNVTAISSAVPEPASIALFGVTTASVAGYCAWRRRKQPATI